MSIKENLEKAAALFGDSHEPKCVVMTEESKQDIIGNDFDITKHEFGGAVQCIESDGCEVTLCCTDGFRYIDLNKSDAIAIAKALGVTADDLI